MATSLIPAFNILIYFFRTGVLPFATWKHRERPIFIKRMGMIRRTIFIGRSPPSGGLTSRLGALDREIAVVHLLEAPSDDEDKTWKNPRSRSDRAAIAARSSRDHTSFIGESSPVDRQAIDEGSGPRSSRDRGGDRGYLEAKLKPNSRRFVAELKPRSMPTESPAQRHQTASTIASIAHDLWANFPL